MKVVPHLDIIEEDRINSILDDPDNYAFDAFACETLDGWVPDIGLSTYPNRSIFRPPVLARSGLTSSLSHRFWETRWGTADHTGERWIGVLLYARAGEECPMELMLGADEIGRVEPQRHDNRRHLIVVDSRVAFRGGMEVIRLNVPGKGTYRIEKFVLLKARPEPGSFAPRIERLTAKRDRKNARIDFITSRGARVLLQAEPKGDKTKETLKVETKEYRKLHAVEMDGLQPNVAYLLTITATESGGESSSKEIVLDAAADSNGIKEKAVSVPVEIISMSDVDGSGMPLSFGIPLPQGQLNQPGRTVLRVNGSETDAQVRIHSRWPDGSARWALVDSACPSPIDPASGSEGEVFIDPQESTSSDGLTCEETPSSIVVRSDNFRISVARDSFPSRIEQRVHEGEWERLVDGKPAAETFHLVLGNGLRLEPGAVRDLKLEEAGGERSVIRYRIPYEDSGGTAHLRSTVRLHIYRAQPFIRLIHRLEVVSPLLASAVGGQIDDCPDGYDEVRPAIAGTEGEEATLLTVRSMGMNLCFPGSEKVNFNGKEYPAPTDSAWRLAHEHDQGYKIESEGGAETIEGRATGPVLINGAKRRLSVGVSNFWQTYPKAVSVGRDTVTLEYLPVLSGDALPGDDDAWHRLYSWHDAGEYRLKTGMALTTESMLAFPESAVESSRLFSWFENPPLVRPSISWMNKTKVLSPLGEKKASPLPQYEAMMDEACDGWMEERESFRQYGFINFGDWYGESGWSWGNNEYDPPYAHYCEFLRGGRPEWAVLAREAVRHLTDVDTCNFSSNPKQIGGQYGHMPGHAGGYLPPYFRSKVGSSCMFASHTWVEGAALHYLLTGDEGVRETLEKTAGWLIGGASWGTIAGGVVVDMAGLVNYDWGQLRTVGWHVIHLSGLARWTDDPRYLNAATILVDQVLERQNGEGGWVRLLQLGHCGCYPPRHRGEATFMVGILLAGLRRYYELTADERVAKAITDGARWLVRNAYDADSKAFRASSCPNSLLGGASSAHQVIEGLAFANSLNPDPELARILKDCEAALGQRRKAASPAENDADKGIGSRLCHESRYVPTFLAYWKLQKQAQGCQNREQ